MYTPEDLNTAIATQEHYERMIAWVKTQPKEEMTSSSAMWNATTEHWGAGKCPCCCAAKLCQSCLFTKVFKKQCGALGWTKMNNAPTWSQWLTHANRLLRNIKKMRKIIEKEVAK